MAGGLPPAVLPGLTSEAEQRVAPRAVDAVPSQQFPQIRAADTSPAGLDPADFGPAAVEDPGGVIERSASLRTEATQRCAEDPAADGWSVGHQGTPLMGRQRGRWMGDERV